MKNKKLVRVLNMMAILVLMVMSMVFAKYL